VTDNYKHSHNSLTTSSILKVDEEEAAEIAEEERAAAIAEKGLYKLLADNEEKHATGEYL
jgi:hypothetical protein